MASDAQIQANRSNAQKSTGPRTAAGKAAVGQNAVKHGLWARQAVIAGEDLGEYEFYRDQMLGELAPEGAMESMLAQRAVGLAWRLRRAERLQNEAFDTLYTEDTTGPFARLTQTLRSRQQARLDSDGEGRDLTCGRVIVRDFANARVLDRLLMYERRLEHSLYKTMAELERLRLVREIDEAATELETDDAQTAPDGAKQTQFASSSKQAKCLAGTNVRAKLAPAPAPKQSQFRPRAVTPTVPNQAPRRYTRSQRAPQALRSWFWIDERSRHEADEQESIRQDPGCDGRFRGGDVSGGRLCEPWLGARPVAPTSQHHLHHE